MKIAFKPLICLVTLIVCLAGCPAAATPPTQQHTIDFRSSDNLKAIFDAGLRPKRYLGIMDQCELKNENLKIILPENTNFSIVVENANIQVLAGNEIDRIEFTGEYTSWATVALQIKNICESLGLQTKEFDVYVEEINKGNQKASPIGFRTQKGGIDIQVGFDQPMLFPDPKTRIWVVLVWPHPNGSMKFLTEPIKPPPSYENFSLDPPPDEPSNNPPIDPAGTEKAVRF